MPARRIDPAALQSFAAAVIEALGTPPDPAAGVAEALVGADLRGHGSHGVRRLATLYPRMIDAGDLDQDATPTVAPVGPGAAVVDGHRGWGHLTGREAVDVGIERVEETGVAVIGVRNGSHMGRIGEFAERAAEADLALVAFVNTGGTAAMAAAPGTTGRNLSVNPYVVGIPTFDALPFPVVLDIATGQVAHGKIMKAALAGKVLPDDWAIADDGAPLTDADEFEAGAGAILPLGGRTFGYKGAGLSITVELLAGLIGGGAVHGQDVTRMVNNGAGFVVVDPTRFLSREACAERVAALAGHLRGLSYDASLVEGPGARSDHALLPGEPEHETRKDREANGIPLDEGAIANLVAVAGEYDVHERPPGFD